MALTPISKQFGKTWPTAVSGPVSLKPIDHGEAADDDGGEARYSLFEVDQSGRILSSEDD